MPELRNNPVSEKTTFCDINVLGCSVENGSTGNLVQKDSKANANRFLLWLLSEPGDYVREPQKGGILYNLIGKLGNEITFRDAENIIVSKFNESFKQDMTLLKCKLSADKFSRKIIVETIIIDNLTKETTETNYEIKDI